jgi:hypothetical protein
MIVDFDDFGTDQERNNLATLIFYQHQRCNSRDSLALALVEAALMWTLGNELSGW